MTRNLMLGTAMVALMLSAPLAQAANNPPTPSTPPAASTKTPAPATTAKAPAPAPAANFVTSQQPDQFLASNFKGTEVDGTDGKQIGSVSDILFDKNGKVLAYVIANGGFLGVGSKDVALPPSAFQVESGKNNSKKLKLSMSANQIKSAQNFKPYEPPKPATTTGSGAMAPSHGPMGGGGTHRGM